MVKNIILAVLIIVLLPKIAFSQISIKGKIIDSNNKPIEIAEILLISEDSTTLRSEFSDIQGDFTIEGPKRNYLLQIRQLGTILYTKQINLNNDINLGIIKVENSQMLKEVTIEGGKKLIEKRVDRLIFNVEVSIAASGGDALDALRITPRVKVQNDKIEMIGKGNLAFMIDDRPIQMSGDDLITFLKTLKADDIKSIEVITNPPAKYKAEGNSGLINIRMKKAKYAFWNTSVRTVYQQATYPTGAAEVSFNYQKGRLTLLADISHINSTNAPLENNNIYYPNLLWLEDNKIKDATKSLSKRINIDYSVSKKLTMGVQYNIINNAPSIDENIISKLINPTTTVIDSLIVTQANTTRKRTPITLNYHFIYKPDSSGKKISVDFDYFNYKNESNRLFETNTLLNNGNLRANSFLSANNIGLQNINNYSLDMDVEHPTKWTTLNYGGRVSFTKTHNFFTVFNLETRFPVLDPNQSNEFIFNEHTQAVYLSAQNEIDKKWQTKLGIRLENTQTEGKSNTINRIAYTKLFPTAYVAYTPNDNHSFSLNYGRRINRPSFILLNPFKWILSPYSYSEGNPYVLPSFTHNVELEHSYGDLLTSSLYFSSLNNGFEQVTIVDEKNNIQQTMPRNFIKNHMIGVNEYINIQPFKWLRVNFLCDIYYSSTTSQIPVTLNFLKGWNGEFTLNNDIILNKSETLLLNASYNYTTAGTDNLDRNTAFSQLNASIKLLLLQKKIQITVYGNDILSSNRPEYTSYSNDIKTISKNYSDIRYIRFAISYILGKKIKNIEQRNNKNEDEINRLEYK